MLYERPLDLHMHTTYSDGLFSVDDVVKRCHDRGLQIISITDHDTIDHIEPAVRSGGGLGMTVIPGTEISVSHNGKGLHLLGYHIDHTSIHLKEELAKQRTARRDRISNMAQKLRDIGWAVDTSAIEGKAGSVGRPLLAQIVFEEVQNRERCKKEEIETFPAFLDRYLTTGAPAYVDRYRTTMQRGIEVIHKAGGVAVWAHPAWNTRKAPETLKPILHDLVQLGMDGLEVFYGTHTREDTEQLFALSQEYGLIQTAGSDFHEPRRPGFPDVGGWDDYGLPWSPDRILSRPF